MEDRTKGLIRKEVGTRAKYLIEGNMKGMELGACLNSINQKRDEQVIYTMKKEGLLHFINSWMKQNPEIVKRWEDIEDLELPRKNHWVCPRDRLHLKTIKDYGGRTRCAEMTREFYEEDFQEKQYHDPFSEMYKIKMVDPQEARETEMPKLTMKGVCYAIIKEPEELALSLDTIIRRISEAGEDRVVMGMDGWALAGYVQKWWQQDGARIYK